MKLGETLNYCGLEEVFLCGSILCSLHVSSGFDVRAGSEMSKGHAFPEGVLAAITLVGGGVDMEAH